MRRVLAWCLVMSLLIVPVQATETGGYETIEMPDVTIMVEPSGNEIALAAEGEFIGTRYENQLSGETLAIYRAIMDSELGPYPTEDTVLTERVSLGLTQTWDPVTFRRETLDSDLEMDAESQQKVNAYLQNVVAQVAPALGALVFDEPELSWLVNLSYGITYKASLSMNWDDASKLSGTGSYTITDIFFYINPEMYEQIAQTGTYADYAQAMERVKAELEDDDGGYDIDHAGTNLYARIRKIHKYVCENVSYAQDDLTQRKYQTIYSALIDPSHTSVCAGYAKMMKVLCDEYNVPCVLIRGTSFGEGHMWNYVQMANGKWYGVDATWDDNISTVSEGFFLKGKDVFDSDHVANFEWTAGYPFVYPELSQSEYVPVSGDPMTGLVVANDRLSIGIDGDGLAFPEEIAPTGVEGQSIVAMRDSSGEWNMIRLNTGIEDAKLGCMVDFYGTHNPETDRYDVYGEVVLNDTTVVYEVAAKDIDMYPNGTSNETGSMVPEIVFTDKDGEKITVPAPEGTPRVPIRDTTNDGIDGYDGTAFLERGLFYRLDAKPNGDLTEGCTQVEEMDIVIAQMGEAVPTVYRLVSLDGGETISYIFNNPNYRVGQITSYRPDLNKITGAAVLGMNNNLSHVEVYRGLEKGDFVVATAENGKAVLHATETVVGKAAAYEKNTVEINGRTYVGSQVFLDEIGFSDLSEFYNSYDGRDAARGAVYLTYDGLILAIDEDAIYPVDISSYAVVLSSGRDEALGVATVKLGLVDGRSETYTVRYFHDLAGNTFDADEVDFSADFADNAKVGSVVSFELIDGELSLTEEEPFGNGAVEIKDEGLVYNGRQLWAMEDSLLFLLYNNSASSRNVEFQVCRMVGMSDCASAAISVAGGGMTRELNGAAILSAARHSHDVLIGAMTYGKSKPSNVIAPDSEGYVVDSVVKYDMETHQNYLEVTMVDLESKTLVTGAYRNLRSGDYMGGAGTTQVGPDAKFAVGSIVEYAVEDTEIVTLIVPEDGSLAHQERTYTQGGSGWFKATIAQVTGSISLYPFGSKTQMTVNAAADFSAIAIANGNPIGSEIETIQPGQEILPDTYNAIVLFNEAGKVTRVISLHNQILGDVNLNGTVDITDAVLLFQHSMLPDLYPIEYTGNMDFTKDGVVDISDAVLLFQYSMLPDLYPIG